MSSTGSGATCLAAHRQNFRHCCSSRSPWRGATGYGGSGSTVCAPFVCGSDARGNRRLLRPLDHGDEVSKQRSGTSLLTMYVPQVFASHHPDVLDRLVDYNAFGILVSQHEGAPCASHLPVLYRRAEGRVILTGHWARANPQWRDIGGQRVLFILHGPHAYISP